MLCEKCQSREATIHNTIVTGFENDMAGPKQINLCQECFGESGPEWAKEMPAAIQAGCGYYLLDFLALTVTN
jgi:protein-arginine kinase activator protein McsA